MIAVSPLSRRLMRRLRALREDKSGIALVEFAAAAPFMLGIFLTATEITNYTIVKMRVSQVALQIADNGSRIGTESLLTSPQISETDINDLLTGAGAQASGLDLYTHGRVIVSSLEPVANPNTTSKFMIRWQRCRGLKNVTSSYGLQSQNNLDGMGPTGQVVKTPDDAGVIYVQVVYDYQPLFSASLVPHIKFDEVAAMTVRAKRDYNGNGGTGVYNNEGATVSGCGTFSAT